MPHDPYHVLGVDRQASPAEIAQAYRRAARTTHPDTGADGAASAERFHAVSEAYETLRDPRRRAAVDRVHALGRNPVRSAVRGAARGVHGGQHIVLGCSQDRLPVTTLARLLEALLRSGW